APTRLYRGADRQALEARRNARPRCTDGHEDTPPLDRGAKPGISSFPEFTRGPIVWEDDLPRRHLERGLPMKRRTSVTPALALALGAAGHAAAHHPPQMDRCASFSFSGQIERIEWHSPHVELFIRTPEGMTHHVSWLAINQLGLAGIDRDTLRVGD